MSEPNKPNNKKKEVLKALELSLGVVTTACKNAGISRWTFYDWIKNDEEFKAGVEDIKEVALDFAESSLHKQIKEGSTPATIFYLKTKGKNRGYVERTEIDLGKRGGNLPEWFDEG